MNVPHELDCGTVLVESENKGTITTRYYFSPYKKTWKDGLYYIAYITWARQWNSFRRMKRGYDDYIRA